MAKHRASHEKLSFLRKTSFRILNTWRKANNSFFEISLSDSKPVFILREPPIVPKYPQVYMKRYGPGQVTVFVPINPKASKLNIETVANMLIHPDDIILHRKGEYGIEIQQAGESLVITQEVSPAKTIVQTDTSTNLSQSINENLPAADETRQDDVSVDPSQLMKKELSIKSATQDEAATDPVQTISSALLDSTSMHDEDETKSLKAMNGIMLANSSTQNEDDINSSQIMNEILPANISTQDEDDVGSLKAKISAKKPQTIRFKKRNRCILS